MEAEDLERMVKIARDALSDDGFYDEVQFTAASFIMQYEMLQMLRAFAAVLEQVAENPMLKSMVPGGFLNK